MGDEAILTGGSDPVSLDSGDVLSGTCGATQVVICLLFGGDLFGRSPALTLMLEESALMTVITWKRNEG